ncbi:hypothetical protein GGI25_004878 [Coemansia spiralis]|uniref:Uncharacterized protein n=1 Tax=Coemansia spiralis TaxID=417178 RepID=A0A9W8G3D2_9FUNG|nr:hypothetical protein GGI25_004878 [Coemansia spiralis]
MAYNDGGYYANGSTNADQPFRRATGKVVMVGGTVTGPVYEYQEQPQQPQLYYPQQQKQQQKRGQPTEPPMFAPFSHLPHRVVDHLMHRVGEPRVFIGSAQSQLIDPAEDINPYRTGTEWTFAESVKFSSPYPTMQNLNSKKRSRFREERRLVFRPRDNEISRWMVHLEILRDFCQLVGLFLGTCGFVRAPLDSSVGSRWPWMIVAGIPQTLGLLWSDLSTTTGKSLGFFVFFAVVSVFFLCLWTYGLYMERPTLKSKGGEITYEEEVVLTPGPFDVVGRVFGKMPKRTRMHIIYAVLTTIYMPMVKLCIEAIVWNQGYWAVANPFRTTDHPIYPKPTDGEKDPSKFCYTTTMHTSRFNGAFVILPFAAVLLVILGFLLPVQIHRLTKHHMPRVPGWADGKVPGQRMPSREQQTLAASVANTRPPTAAGSAVGSRNVRAADGARPLMSNMDDPNPMLTADALLQGLGQTGLVGSQHMAYLGALNGLLTAANATGAGQQFNSSLSGWANSLWKRVQEMWTGTKQSVEDPYWGMEKDEAYQARLRDMRTSHRNRHLATVQYRRALDSDTSDYRFLYVPHYPVHASDPARALLWKLVAIITVVVLAKDNCWAKSRSRHVMDSARCSMLLLIALLMLRSHHAHRPFFDPTANLSQLFMRLSIVCTAIFAFPLFLLDPMSETHTGLCVTLLVLNLLSFLAMLWLASSSMPQVEVKIRGPRVPLVLSPGILVATTPNDPRLRRLLIERVWQDTWSAILLASRDFRLLPNHHVAFCRTQAHPPYMVNYIGFAAERHLENLHLYDAIGRHAYCQAILWERQHETRGLLMDEISRNLTGPDMYFCPTGAMGERFSLGRVRSWFGKVYILHFPFMVCMVYDEAPDMIVPIGEEDDLRVYLEQNRDPLVVEKREIRRKLRALDNQYVTLTYIEHSGPNGSHLRYCLPLYAEENEQYLAQFAGRRRVLYRGLFTIKQQGEQRFDIVNVTPGFDCSLELTHETYVEDEDLVNNLDREQNPFRMEFWRTGGKGNISLRSRETLRVTAHNRHLLGVTTTFEQTLDLRALFDENADIIDARLPEVHSAITRYQEESYNGFVRKRTGLTPSFHIDVFAPGPESYHVTQMEQRPVAMTPSLYPEWGGHGRVSFIPSREQLADRLERFEQNPYVRNLLTDHKDDIALLYERLRTLVPSESNDPVKLAWYLFWDDLYRRYAQEVAQLKQFDVDFNPLYPGALPYYPMPRARLERFLYDRGLWRPLRSIGVLPSYSSQGLVGAIRRWFGADRKVSQGGGGFGNVDPLPVPTYVPGVTAGQEQVARVWRAGDQDDPEAPFISGVPAAGFLHSGLLNRLYAWLDVIANGVDR